MSEILNAWKYRQSNGFRAFGFLVLISCMISDLDICRTVSMSEMLKIYFTDYTFVAEILSCYHSCLILTWWIMSQNYLYLYNHYERNKYDNSKPHVYIWVHNLLWPPFSLYKLRTLKHCDQDQQKARGSTVKWLIQPLDFQKSLL